MVEHAGSSRPDAVASISPTGVKIILDAPTNTLTAGISVTNISLSTSKTYKLAFGGAGQSAYIDDNQFAALQTANAGDNSVTEQRLFKAPTTATATAASNYIVSSDAIKANAQLFPGGGFCTDCNFIKWGAWGTQVAYGTNTDAVHLGWWVAGDVLPNNAVPTTKMTAHYDGNAIGDVTRKQGQDWLTYVATGDMQMDWNFGERSGRLAINNFDKSVNDGRGYDFSGTMLHVPGSGGSPNQFAGVIGGNGLIGGATGSFVGPMSGTPSAPQGVIGSWNVGNNNYNAVGIFAGAQHGTAVVAGR